MDSDTRMALRARGQDAKALTTVQEVIGYMEACEETERYQVQCEVLEQITQYHAKAGDMIEDIFDYIKGSGAYKDHLSEEEFTQTWGTVQDIVDYNKKRQNWYQEVMNLVLKHWVEDEPRAWFQSADMSTTFLETVSKVARKMSFGSAVRRVNYAVVKRIKTPRRSILNARRHITGDWNAAITITEEPSQLEVTELREHGMGLDTYGFVVEEGSPLMALMDVDGPSKYSGLAKVILFSYSNIICG
jgi:hypothetical protein